MTLRALRDDEFHAELAEFARHYSEFAPRPDFV